MMNPRETKLDAVRNAVYNSLRVALVGRDYVGRYLGFFEDRSRRLAMPSAEGEREEG
jgi:hypothetical protein